MKREAIALSVESLHRELDGVDGYVYVPMEDGMCVVAPSLPELLETVEAYISLYNVGIAGSGVATQDEVLYFEDVEDLLNVTRDDIELIDLVLGSTTLKCGGIAKIVVKDWNVSELGEIFGDARIGKFLKVNGCSGKHCSRIRYGRNGWYYVAGQDYPAEIKRIIQRFKREFNL